MRLPTPLLLVHFRLLNPVEERLRFSLPNGEFYVLSPRFCLQPMTHAEVWRSLIKGA